MRLDLCVEFPNDAEFLKSDVLQDSDMHQELTVNFQLLKLCTVRFQAQAVKWRHFAWLYI